MILRFEESYISNRTEMASPKQHRETHVSNPRRGPTKADQIHHELPASFSLVMAGAPARPAAVVHGDRSWRAPGRSVC